MAALHTQDSSFAQDVLTSSSDKPVLVDFWATWCGPCRQLAPILDEVASEMGDKVKITKMNIEESPETPSKYGVRGIPTLIMFKNGQAVATKVGSLPKGALIKWIEENAA